MPLNLIKGISYFYSVPEGIRTPIVGTGNQNSIH